MFEVQKHGYGYTLWVFIAHTNDVQLRTYTLCSYVFAKRPIVAGKFIFIELLQFHFDFSSI